MPEAELLDRAIAKAEQLASIPPETFGHTKRSLRDRFWTEVETTGRQRDAEMLELWKSPDGLAAVSAYVAEDAREVGSRWPTPPPPARPFAPWDRRELPGLFTVEESARRVGHYAWIEMRLFEALGGWVATVPELDVKTTLGRHCYHHAWHAELWVKRLPELREMRPERLIQPPNADMEAFVAASTEPEAPGPHDREARRRVPGAAPPQDRRLHATTWPPPAGSPTPRRSAPWGSSSTTRRRTGGRARCSSSR